MPNDRLQRIRNCNDYLHYANFGANGRAAAGTPRRQRVAPAGRAKYVLVTNTNNNRLSIFQGFVILFAL